MIKLASEAEATLSSFYEEMRDKGAPRLRAAGWAAFSEVWRAEPARRGLALHGSENGDGQAGAARHRLPRRIVAAARA